MRMLRSASLAVLACGISLAASATPVTSPFQAIAHKFNHNQPAGKPAQTPALAPEPSSIMLLGTGLVGSVGMLRRRMRRA